MSIFLGCIELSVIRAATGYQGRRLQLLIQESKNGMSASESFLVRLAV